METHPLLTSLATSLQEKLSSAISSLTHQPVHLTLEHSGIVPIMDVHTLVGDGTASCTTVYIPLLGDVVGDIFVLLPNEAATNLADLMIGNPPHTTQIVGEFERSAVMEMGNITTGVIVTELANSLKLSIMLTTPNLTSDMPSAFIDQVLIMYSASANDLLAIQFPFTVAEASINGTFLLLFDKSSSEKIEQALSLTPKE